VHNTFVVVADAIKDGLRGRIHVSFSLEVVLVAFKGQIYFTLVSYENTGLKQISVDLTWHNIFEVYFYICISVVPSLLMEKSSCMDNLMDCIPLRTLIA
jgi:hypothetical protein